MVSAILSRVVILVFGTLYPAYASYKAVKTKNVKEYVKWMMYWIVFALFCAAETFADVFLSWIPFYYEIKMIFVFWLLSPVTRGSSFIYRKFVHPNLAKREKEIDEAIAQARTKGYSTLMTLGHRGLTYATNVVVNTAIKGQSTLVEQIKKSYSTNDLRVRDDRGRRGGRDDVDGVPYIDDSDEEFGLTLQESSTETSDTSLIPSSRAQTQNPSSKSVAETGTSNPKPTALSSKQSARSKISESQSSSKLSKPSDKTKSTSKKGSENRLRADNKELDRREKQDFEKRERRPLARSKSDASERRPKRSRPNSGLSRVEEVEHENTMAMLEKERGGEIDEVIETSDTYTEEIIYYSPRKSGHYTSKEVKSDPYATLPRTRSRQRPRLHQH
ncbi:receptor expression-enhancing protein 2-like isoform X2 [Ruditapes philippinarum]|uniref:receptor expression-enhancing protein 2-like isoform X2 n=1 Tax=Ruditapes philippinarum TaxID=129788 RepID=UPI00295C251E|nr:receptor expression-enhancing protein 2-like isoform X2 [Ruditapes philippinarum]